MVDIPDNSRLVAEAFRLTNIEHMFLYFDAVARGVLPCKLRSSERGTTSHHDLVPQLGNQFPRPLDPSAPTPTLPLARLIPDASKQNLNGPYVRDIEAHANGYT